MVFLSDYPELVVLQTLAQRKKVSVYLVGGFLRDYLLGRPCFDTSAAFKPRPSGRGKVKPLSVNPEQAPGFPPKADPPSADSPGTVEWVDLDFAVTQGAIALARTFAKKIKGAFVLLDEEHGCARVARKRSGRIETFDFADFRAPSLRADLSHRDFTINTLCVDIQKLQSAAELSEILIDLKHGLRDLRAKKIRMISTKVFHEDPLRLLRAYSLRAQLAFKIDPKTRAQIKKNRDLIRGVAYERIREELFKILESDHTAENLKAMDQIGLLVKIMPHISVMYHVKQGTYHHLDVWPHSLEAVLQLEKLCVEWEDNEEMMNYLKEPLSGQHSRRSILKLAALLHDIGKPQTRKKEEGRISFHSHERVGKSISRDLAKLLKLSSRERSVLELMVLWHLRPGYLSNFQQPSEKAVYRYFRDTREEAASIALLSWADQRATCGPMTTQRDQKHHEKICRNLIQRYFEKSKEKPIVRLLTGNDLIWSLKLKPSPLFGKILKAVEEAQALEKITTREAALDFAAKMISHEDKRD